MPKNPPNNDEALANAAVAELAKAREELASRMRKAGLHASDGWRVSEEIKHTIDGTVWLFRPIHSRNPSPTLTASVGLDDAGHVSKVVVTE